MGCARKARGRSLAIYINDLIDIMKKRNTFYTPTVLRKIKVNEWCSLIGC